MKYIKERENTKLTQKRLKSLLIYDPLFGIFTRKGDRGTATAGSIAGYKLSTGYINISIDNKTYRTHKLAWLYMEGFMTANVVHHINNIKHDNRWDNLEEQIRNYNESINLIEENTYLEA